MNRRQWISDTWKPIFTNSDSPSVFFSSWGHDRVEARAGEMSSQFLLGELKVTRDQLGEVCFFPSILRLFNFGGGGGGGGILNLEMCNRLLSM